MVPFSYFSALKDINITRKIFYFGDKSYGVVSAYNNKCYRYTLFNLYVDKGNRINFVLLLIKPSKEHVDKLYWMVVYKENFLEITSEMLAISIAYRISYK